MNNSTPSLNSFENGEKYAEARSQFIADHSISEENFNRMLENGEISLILNAETEKYELKRKEENTSGSVDLNQETVRNQALTIVAQKSSVDENDESNNSEVVEAEVVENNKKTPSLKTILGTTVVIAFIAMIAYNQASLREAFQKFFSQAPQVQASVTKSEQETQMTQLLNSLQNQGEFIKAVANLRSQLQQQIDLVNANIKRLKSEGRPTEQSEQQLKGLKKQLKNIDKVSPEVADIPQLAKQIQVMAEFQKTFDKLQAISFQKAMEIQDLQQSAAIKSFSLDQQQKVVKAQQESLKTLLKAYEEVNQSMAPVQKTSVQEEISNAGSQSSRNSEIPVGSTVYGAQELKESFDSWEKVFDTQLEIDLLNRTKKLRSQVLKDGKSSIQLNPQQQTEYSNLYNNYVSLTDN